MVGLRRFQPALVLAAGLATLPLSAAAFGDDLKIVLIAPVSGPMARQGDLMRKGAELAIEDINAAGGIKALGGARLALVVEDAGDKVETAKNAAQRLVANRDGVVAGTGSWSSSLTLAVTEVTERAELPWLTLSYADQITDRGFHYVVQTVPVASQLALDSMPTVLDMAQAASGRRPTKVAIISDSTAASQAFVKPLREGGFAKLGVTVVADEIFTPPLTDATAMVQKLRATRPDFLLFYSTGFPDAKLVLTKMNEFGLGKGRLPAVTVGVQLASPEMLKAVGADLLEGLVVAPNWPSKAQEAALPALTRRSGEPWLGQDTISTYGDIWLVKDALERAGSTDGAKVMAALRATNRSDGPADYYLGDRLAFDDKGRRVGGAVGLVQWQGGMPYLIWPKAAATRAPLGAEAAARIAALSGEGKTVSLVVADGAVAGAIALRDAPRADAAAGIEALRRKGIRTLMLTGDTPHAAAAIGRALDMEVRAGLLPEDKLRIVSDLRRAGAVVAKVGDGINDAPALATADVGIAMGGGTDVALETADAALLHGRVRDVAALVALSRRTMGNIRQNIALSLGLKAVFLVTTVVGVTGLWPAILADTGATVLVTANALRLLAPRES